MASENPLDPIQQLARVIVGGIFPGREGVEEVNRLDAELGPNSTAWSLLESAAR